MKKFVTMLGLVLVLLGTIQVSAHEKVEVVNTICNSQTTELKMEIRRLWIQHVLWTRNFVISDVSNLPDKEVVLERLLKNQDDTGNAIKPFYGEDAGNALAKLLREHIVLAGQVVDAAKNNDTVALEKSNKLWYKNADDIAEFLSEANPYWDYQEVKDLLYVHLDLLKEQVGAYIKGDWKADIEAYDRGEDHILMLADAISSGIINQFPEKFQ